MGPQEADTPSVVAAQSMPVPIDHVLVEEVEAWEAGALAAR